MPSQDQLHELWAQYGRALLGVVVFGLLLHDIFGPHGYMAMRKTRQEIQHVQTQIGCLNRENAELSDEVKALKSDPHKIEGIARDELGLARSGEVIIKIPKSEQAQSADPKSCLQPAVAP